MSDYARIHVKRVVKGRMGKLVHLPRLRKQSTPPEYSAYRLLVWQAVHQPSLTKWEQLKRYLLRLMYKY